MRVRRRKIRFRKKKTIQILLGKKKRQNNLQQFRIQGLPTFPTQSRNSIQLLKKEKIPFHDRKF